MKTVLLTPYRRTPERDRLWAFTRAWIATNYDFPLFESDSHGARFSPSQARNRAAKLAGDWDVAVFHDADTIAHPEAVLAAIAQAATTDSMVIAADSHMYCDRYSTNRILMSGVPMFPRPDTFDTRGIYEKPCSGVFAVNRHVWESTGGYIDTLTGWGYEDLCFLQLCKLFAQGHTYIPGHITLHLWHPPSVRDRDTNTNKMVWQTLAKYARRNDTDGARTYLQSLGR